MLETDEGFSKIRNWNAGKDTLVLSTVNGILAFVSEYGHIDCCGGGEYANAYLYELS